MLVLSRKKYEELVIQVGGDTVIVRVVDLRRSGVRLGIIAPKSVAVHRQEVARRIDQEQRATSGVAAEAEPVAV
jgi:carbon storage regulator